MTLSVASQESPRNLAQLGNELSRLATAGRIDALSPHRLWLEHVGVAHATDEGMTAHPDWLECALPCADQGELLTRTLLRDPRYRLHVDLILSSVCREIGRSARWRRLEELLTGSLFTIAPRIASLLGMPPEDPSLANAWSTFDQHCWGRAGSGEVLFPLIIAQLPLLATTPVYLRTTEPLLARLVIAILAADGLRLSTDEVSTCEALGRSGVPLWIRTLHGGVHEVCLVGPVRSEFDAPAVAGPDSTPFSLGVPTLAARKSAMVSGRRLRFDTLWVALGTDELSHGFVGVSAGQTWPTHDSSDLPSQDALRALIRARTTVSGAPDAADNALRSLSAHPLYGFWLQVLLLEALDRELSEPTLLLAASSEPGNANIDAYYRPRPNVRRPVAPATRLVGPLEQVLDRMAMSMNIRAVGLLGPGSGPWAHALSLMSQVGLVVQMGHRWALAPHVLDRLHGGGLMTAVIRHGKDLRDRLRVTLDSVWAERAEET